MIKIMIIIFCLLLISGVSGKLLFSALQRYHDIKYHSALPKTVTFFSPDIINGIIPKELTGQGSDISPAVEWSNAPEGTLSYAVIMTDNDAPSPVFKLMTVDHWVLFNIPRSTGSLAGGMSLKKVNETGISAGKNITGNCEYIGPNPPFGKHQYIFRVYALAVPEINLEAPSRKELMERMKGNILSFGEFTAFYQKQ